MCKKLHEKVNAIFDGIAYRSGCRTILRLENWKRNDKPIVTMKRQ